MTFAKINPLTRGSAGVMLIMGVLALTLLMLAGCGKKNAAVAA